MALHPPSDGPSAGVVEQLNAHIAKRGPDCVNALGKEDWDWLLRARDEIVRLEREVNEWNSPHVEHLESQLSAALADAERWRMLMHLGTCYHDYKDGEERFIWSGSKRVYFHECDETQAITLTEYIDAALRAGDRDG